jgi:hypothetical protein
VDEGRLGGVASCCAQMEETRLWPSARYGQAVSISGRRDRALVAGWPLTSESASEVPGRAERARSAPLAVPERARSR